MRAAEAFAGAPLYRGRWATLVCMWSAGFLAGDTDVDVVLTALGQTRSGGHHWGVDAVMLTVGFGFLVWGVLSLDQYGRNAWFAWAPDDAEWSGFTRDEVNRRPWSWRR